MTFAYVFWGLAGSILALHLAAIINRPGPHMRPEDFTNRKKGCQCQWEEGDSPCPVHGTEG